MLNNLGLGILLEAKDEFSHVMEKAKHQFHEVDKSSEKLATETAKHLGKWTLAIAAASVAAVAAGGAIAYHLASEAAEGSMIIAQAGARAGATAEQMEALRKAADNVGLRGLGTSGDEAATMLKELIVNGMGVEGALASLDATIRLTKASMGELAGPQAAQAVANILKEFHLNAGDSGDVVDKLAVAMRMFGASATDLVPMVTGVARGAQLAGASFEDALAAVGLAKKVMPDAGTAIMGVNMALSGLAGGAARAKLGALGVRTIDSMTGGMRPLLSILADLDKRMSGLSEGDKARKIGAVFGPRGAGTIVAIMAELGRGIRAASGEMVYGARAAEELNRQMANSRGAAAEMTAGLEGEFKTQQNRVRKSAATMIDFLGEPFKEVLTPVLAGVNYMLKSINRSLADGSGVWGAVGAAAAKVGLAFQGIVQLFEQGGFSGKVLEEMDKAENSGIQKFAIQVWHWVGVIKEAWNGMVEGWDSTMDTLQPVFDGLSEAFTTLASALGISWATSEENASTWDSASKVGRVFGETIAWIAGTVAGGLITTLNIANGTIAAFRSGWILLKPIVMPILRVIYDGLLIISGFLELDMKKSMQGFAALAVDALSFVIGLVADLVKIMASAVDWIGSVFGADLGLGESVGKQLDAALAEVSKFRESLLETPTVAIAGPTQTQIAPQDVGQMSTNAGASAVPAAAMASVISGGTKKAVNQSLVSANESVGPSEATITSYLILDGEKVAEATQKAQLRKKARSFHAIPVGQE